MAVRDEDFGADLTLVESGDGIWSPPEAAPAYTPRDWRSEYEREHARAERERARADAAEARCEELRWAEVDSRARAGSLKWQLDRSRSKLKAAVEETQEVRRTAKDALSLQAEVTRLEKLLSEASIEPVKRTSTLATGKERRRLRATLERAENHKDTTKALRAERGELRKEVNRHRLSKAFCRRIGWFKPDGGLKDMMARVTMLDMHRDSLIVLPPKQGRQNRPKPIVFGPDTEPPLFPTPTTLDEVRPLTLRPVVRGTREGKLWNEFIARYHYLGYRTLVGAQMRYAVHDRDGWPVAMLGFSTAAWKLAPRDTFIGWTPQLREKNLPLMVDNPRFLILPWINIPNLGSHILAIIRRRLPEDWTERYNTTPVLIETFVETPRYTGAVYRASGWIHVGTTQGRGRYDRDKLYDKPRKDIWLRPLRRDWKRTLNR